MTRIRACTAAPLSPHTSGIFQEGSGQAAQAVGVGPGTWAVIDYEGRCTPGTAPPLMDSTQINFLLCQFYRVPRAYKEFYQAIRTRKRMNIFVLAET